MEIQKSGLDVNIWKILWNLERLAAMWQHPSWGYCLTMGKKAFCQQLHSLVSLVQKRDADLTQDDAQINSVTQQHKKIRSPVWQTSEM